MARVNTQKETIEIKHPKFKEVKVIAKKLDPIEAMDLFVGLQEYQKVVVLTDPSTKEVLLDEEGNPRVHVLSNIPATAVIDILEEVLESWEGIEDEKSKPIPFKRENFKYLFKKELNCPVKKKIKDPKTKKEVEKEVQISFADYIQAEVNKTAQEDDPDPKLKG